MRALGDGGSPGVHGSPGAHGFLGADRDDRGVRGALDTNVTLPAITGLADPVITESAEPILTDFVDVDNVGFDHAVRDFDRDLHFANGNNHNSRGNPKGHGK